MGLYGQLPGRYDELLAGLTVYQARPGPRTARTLGAPGVGLGRALRWLEPATSCLPYIGDPIMLIGGVLHFHLGYVLLLGLGTRVVRYVLLIGLLGR